MKWEYKVIEINSVQNLGDPANLQNELNNYGEKVDDGSVIFKRALGRA